MEIDSEWVDLAVEYSQPGDIYFIRMDHLIL